MYEPYKFIALYFSFTAKEQLNPTILKHMSSLQNISKAILAQETWNLAQETENVKHCLNKQ